MKSNNVEDKPLVSVSIPAYNKPEYTRKTLRSIIEQTYRPIEIILSDDGSPNSLAFLAEEISNIDDEALIIRFYRHEKNLGPLKNITFSALEAKGKYLMLMPHDDWLVDDLFIAETVLLMEGDGDCNLCCANSLLENTDEPMNIHLPSYLQADNDWVLVNGDEYINLLGGDIEYQAYSAIICNWEKLNKMGAYRYPFCLDEEIAAPLGIMPDEGFVFQFLLSSIGSVAVTNKVVSVRGEPPDSYSRSQAWHQVVGQALFMLMFNIYSSNLDGKYAKAIKKRAKYWAVFYFPVERLNLKILKHYKYNYMAVLLMIASYIYSLLTRNFYVLFVKRLYSIIKNNGFTYLIEKVKTKSKERGIVFYLKRIFMPFVIK
jgi:glycosyltransferase involved in cell wall biosynthesis